MSRFRHSVSVHSMLIVVIVALAFLFSGWSLSAYASYRRDNARIRLRYGQMTLALAANQTNASILLFAPEFRRRADRSVDMLARFAKPLRSGAWVRTSGSRATVCPEPVLRYHLPIGGHTVEMIKVDGEWFFTGGIHID
jgi:hypothetical protein